MKHFFLFCPRYAAQRNRLLLTSAANILGETWSSSSDVVSFAAVFRGVTQRSPEGNLSLRDIPKDGCEGAGSDAKKLNFLLYGVKSANYDITCALIREVHTFIINTNRFSMATI